MNYLGHLLLTYPEPELTMGNLLGDMLRGRQVSILPEGIRRGVEMHHFIDRFTDTYDGIRRLVDLVRPGHGKYAPVVIDVLLDHVLALQWEEHSTLGYQEFTEWVYHDMVPSQKHVVDGPVSERITSMAKHRWLDGYPTTGGMAYVLARMDRRTSFPSRFTEAMEDLHSHNDVFQEEFRIFYRALSSALAQKFPGMTQVLPS